MGSSNANSGRFYVIDEGADVIRGRVHGVRGDEDAVDEGVRPNREGDDANPESCGPIHEHGGSLEGPVSELTAGVVALGDRVLARLDGCDGFDALVDVMQEGVG